MTRTAPSGLELLEEHECWLALGVEGRGSVDVARHALPAPVPLAFAVDGCDLLLSTQDHPGLREVLDGAVAAVEADVDSHSASWRIVLVGPARAEGRLIRLRASDVTGYRLPATTLLRS